MLLKMNADHIKDVVDIHCECFRDSFLTSLDRGVLAPMYNNCVSDELGCAYVYIENGAIFGYIVGVVNPSMYYNQLLKKIGLRMFWGALKRVMQNPKILVSIARRNYSGFFRPDTSEESYRRASLDTIAVKPQYWGTGIAQQLLERFLDDLRSRGLSEVHLGVTAANVRARRFYEKMGFQHIRVCKDNYGRQSCIYQLTLWQEGKRARG